MNKMPKIAKEEAETLLFDVPVTNRYDFELLN